VDDPRQRHGNHTWDLVIEYLQCPHCGYIIEDRNKYEHREDRLEKNLVCSRCNEKFTKTKKNHHTFGPLFGHD
jgi:DNA-directed RNA polymerase subunit RPC12/RpoP